MIQLLNFLRASELCVWGRRGFFFHEMFAVSKDGPAGAPAVEFVYQGARAHVCVFSIAVLECWPWSKGTVQHGPLVSRVDIWEPSEQRQRADTATVPLVSGSSVGSMLVSDWPCPFLLKWQGTQTAARYRYTQNINGPSALRCLWFFVVLFCFQVKPLSFLLLKEETKSPK